MKAVIKSGDWLTDEHMYLAQDILQKQFPHTEGWQSTLLVQTDGFIPVQSEAIQIHLVSGNHWVTSSSLNQEVTVYDSRLQRGKLSSTFTHQLCQIYRTLIKAEIQSSEKAGNLIVHLPVIQRQTGGSDCGLFAIAFALHAALGHCVSDLEFNQLKMRSHLFKCLAARNFTPFPILDECSKEQRKLCIQNISVYCTCLMPDTFGDMIQCETCHKWFHAKCLGLLTLPNCNEKWYCSSCH